MPPISISPPIIVLSIKCIIALFQGAFRPPPWSSKVFSILVNRLLLLASIAHMTIGIDRRVY